MFEQETEMEQWHCHFPHSYYCDPHNRSNKTVDTGIGDDIYLLHLKYKPTWSHRWPGSFNEQFDLNHEHKSEATMCYCVQIAIMWANIQETWSYWKSVLILCSVPGLFNI